MALLPSELRRIKYELGWNVLAAGAEPYIGVAAIFDQVVATYTTAGAVASSATAVVVATGAAPAPFTLTLSSPTGFSLFDRAVVDVDGQQEIATIQSISGSAITVALARSHSGTYPVTVEGGESIVRELLQQLYECQTRIGRAAGTAGIKKVDEVEFFQAGSGHKSRLNELQEHREYLRDELCGALFGQGRRAFFGQAAGSFSGSHSVELY